MQAGMPGMPGMPGQPSFQQWSPGMPGMPGMQQPMQPGMPGHYPQYVQQAPPPPQDQMADMLANMRRLREFTEAMGVSPSKDIDLKIREMEQKMFQQQQQHQEALNEMRMGQLMDQIKQLKDERKTELHSARQEPEEKEEKPKLPPFEDVNGVKIPRDPESGELDYNMAKIAALNSGMLMEQLVALVSIYKDHKDNERKAMVAQTEAQASVIRAQMQQQAPVLHGGAVNDSDVASAPSPKYAEREPPPTPAPPPPAPPAPPPVQERQQVVFVTPPRPVALEDAPSAEEVAETAELADDPGVCAT